MEDLDAKLWKAEEEREILQEQVESLKLELAAAREEKASLYQEIDWCNQELGALCAEIHKYIQQLESEQERRRDLEQMLAASNKTSFLQPFLERRISGKLRLEAMELRKKAFKTRFEAWQMRQDRYRQEQQGQNCLQKLLL